MKDPALALALAKVIIAAAWADGQIQEEERECIKDLLYQLPDLSDKDMRSLEKYLESPIGPTEQLILTEILISKLKTKEDKSFTLYSLERLIAVDGRVTEEERMFVRNIEQQIKKASPPEIFGQLKTFLKKPMQARTANAAESFKSKNLNDFISSEVEVIQKENLAPNLIEKNKLQKLCLAGILLSKVVWADGRIQESEVNIIVDFLQKAWDLEANNAYLVAKISLDPQVKDLDIMRTCRALFEVTKLSERVKFLDILFRIAYADGTLSSNEVEMIIEITAHLKLEQDHFHNAFMKYSPQANVA